jgi:hypothetical protein
MMASSSRRDSVPFARVSIDPTTLITGIPGQGGKATNSNVVLVTNAQAGRGGQTTVTGESPLSHDHVQHSSSFSQEQPDTPLSTSVSSKLFQPLPNTIQVRASFGAPDNATPRRKAIHRVGSISSLDMSMAVTPDSVKLILKDNIRAHIFRHVKFWDRDEHGPFSEEPNTVCGIVLRLCNVLTKPNIHAPTWWRETKQFVIKTHTDQRNNCIKTVHLRFNGTCSGCAIIFPFILTHHDLYNRDC